MTDQPSTPPEKDPQSGQSPPQGYGSPVPPPTPPSYPGPGGGYPPPPGYGYPQPGGYPPPGYGSPFSQAPPKHPSATTALVLGIVSVAGGFACLLPLLAAPFAWITGAKAVKEIDANPQAYSGRNEANTGKIMGIIGTVLLVLGLLGIAAIVAIGVSGGFDDDEYYYDDDYSLIQAF